jgi:hypothetical protein
MFKLPFTVLPVFAEATHKLAKSQEDAIIVEVDAIGFNSQTTAPQLESTVVRLSL